MNMNDDKWIKDLHDRLEDYSAPLPKGLWEELEEELSQPEVKVIPFWRKWQPVAAAVAVLAVSSFALFKWLLPAMDDVAMQQSNQLAEQLVNEADSFVPAEQNPADGDVAPQQLTSEKTFPEKVVAMLRTAPAVSGGHDEAEAAPVALTPEEGIALAANEDDTDIAGQETFGYAESEEETAKKTEEQQHATSAAYSRLRSAERTRAYTPSQYQTRKRNTTSDRGIQVGLFAGGMPYSSSKQFQGMGRFSSRYASVQRKDILVSHMDGKESAYSQVLFNNQNSDAKTGIKHHLPVNVAATVKWHFTENWALESGLSYTYLQSDLHAGSNLYMEEQQKLHYVGIPLKIHRNIWNNSFLSVYASAGGMIEKCVSGKLESTYVTGTSPKETESTSLSVDPLQFSLSAALGAQVNFTSLVSVFVEPGAAYYFDDNSNIETIRKEHPFNFNLQFGLRFDISK